MDGIQDDIPAEYLGPKMLALPNDRWRRFAFIMGHGELVRADAAREAGFSDVKDGCKVRASEMMQDARVIDAIREVGGKALWALAPIAVREAKDVMLDKKHPYRGRMIETIMNRAGYAEKTEHKVTVEHTVDMKELEALARRLAAESGVPVHRLLGTDAKVIEGTAVEVKDGISKDDARDSSVVLQSQPGE